jgi:hypothetical protein
MAVMPGWKAKAVLSTKLLNPVIWSDLMRNRPPVPARVQRASTAGGAM